MLTQRQLSLFRDIEDSPRRRGGASDGSTADEFPDNSDEDPSTSVGTVSWGEIKEESR